MWSHWPLAGSNST